MDNVLYPVIGKVPVLFGEVHYVTIVFQSEVEQHLAIGLLQLAVQDTGKEGYALIRCVGYIKKQVLQS